MMETVVFDKLSSTGFLINSKYLLTLPDKTVDDLCERAARRGMIDQHSQMTMEDEMAALKESVHSQQSTCHSFKAPTLGMWIVPWMIPESMRAVERSDGTR